MPTSKDSVGAGGLTGTAGQGGGESLLQWKILAFTDVNALDRCELKRKVSAPHHVL